MVQNDEATRPGLNLRDAVQVSKALGHPGRVRLLAMLRGGELCVCQLTAALGLATSTVSGHLAELRRARLVEEDKRGRWVHYRLAAEGAAAEVAGQILGLLAEDLQTRADADLIGRIRQHPPEDLCEAGLDLAALGIEPAPAPTSRRG